jgi:hypothetical protein
VLAARNAQAEATIVIGFGKDRLALDVHQHTLDRLLRPIIDDDACDSGLREHIGRHTDRHQKETKHTIRCHAARR